MTFFFQRTQCVLETCLLTKKRFIYTDSYKYAGNVIKYTVLVLEAVKLTFLYHQSVAERKQMVKTVISVFTFITIKILCLQGVKFSLSPLILTVVDRVTDPVLEVKKQQLREEKGFALG